MCSETTDHELFVELSKDVPAHKTAALQALHDGVGASFAATVDATRRCKGNVVLTGIGKSYPIAQKISALMASTGTPSTTLHPVDALPADLRRVRNGDVLIMLSNSGSAEETVSFARTTLKFDVTRIAVTGQPASPLAQLCHVTLNIGLLEEACPLGVAPSSTSTAMLALGDALTLVLFQVNGFSLKSFAELHPGGAIGRRLLPASSAMRPRKEVATVAPTSSVLEAIQEITARKNGAACVVNSGGTLVGMFTDGNLRRLLTKDPASLMDPIERCMSRNPRSIRSDVTAGEALHILRESQIDELPVVDHHGRLVGLIDIQDIA